MKKFLLGFFFIVSVILISAFTYNTETNTETDKAMLGIYGNVSRNGTAVANQTVWIGKGGFNTTTTTNSSGNYSVPTNDLDGPGTYTVSVSWCNGPDWYHGSNTGYLGAFSVRIDVPVLLDKGGCPIEQQQLKYLTIIICLYAVTIKKNAELCNLRPTEK